MKISLLPSSTATSAAFRIEDEDHTLGNALRHCVLLNPAVDFCGYAIPHPSEAVLHFRIQTDDSTTAEQALHRGLDDLIAMCQVVEDKFSQAL